MSQKVTRKLQNAGSEEKEKRQTDSPVKEMKKKIAANADKEKQVVEKTDKNDKTDTKSAEKSDKVTEKGDKSDKDDKQEKKDSKHTDKPAEKKVEKQAEKKTDKPVDKKTEKPVDKKVVKPADKKPEQNDKKEDGSSDKNAKPQEKGKPNGKQPTQQSSTTSNGVHISDGGTVSGSSDDDTFPELAYDDNDEADVDPEPRAFTRRSQVKATKTPETPRPASDKDDDSKEKEKVLKLNDTPVSDRILRSADSPKPDSKKEQKKDSTNEQNDQKDSQEDSKKDTENKDRKKDENQDKIEVEVVEIEAEECRVKTRARVSPYTRQTHDTTTTSLLANYTGNNTTMEMDISECSIPDEPPTDDSGYLRGLRGIKGRSSYRHCDVNIQQLIANRVMRNSLHNIASESQSRPTAPVVGRKRKPDTESSIELATEAETLDTVSRHRHYSTGKRMRLIDTLTGPFRRTLPARRAAEIVGINTDLPLTAPVASTSTFDPETLKPSADPTPTPTMPTMATSTPTHDKRCVIM